MSFFKKIFSGKDTSKYAPVDETPVDKSEFRVYPRLRSNQWKALDYIYHIPLAGDIVLCFIQDINDNMAYITKEEAENLTAQISKWKENIEKESFNIFSTDEWENVAVFNKPGDFSTEKIFDSIFIEDACKKLNADKLIFSVSRRYRTMATGFYQSFEEIERFLYKHFSTWRDEELGGDPITEMVLIAENNCITHIVPLGFRMNLYKKDDRVLLSYSTMNEIISEGKIDFKKIMEDNKIIFPQEVKM